jgi:hypothetical protein
MSRSFELLQLASVRTIQQLVRTTLSVPPKLQDFFPKHRYGKIAAIVRTTWIPVQTHSSHKASITIQIQTSGRQSSWSGSASIRYGNCRHQICRPDDHPPSPDARSLYMEITCSGRTTVRKTGHHRPDAAHFRKEF